MRRRTDDDPHRWVLSWLDLLMMTCFGSILLMMVQSRGCKMLQRRHSRNEWMQNVACYSNSSVSNAAASPRWRGHYEKNKCCNDGWDDNCALGFCVCACKGVTRLKFKGQPPLPFPPSPPSFFLPSSLFPSLYQLYRGMGSAVSSPSGVWVEAPAAEQFGAYLSQKRTALWQQFYGFRIKISSVFWSEWVSQWLVS